MDKLNLETLISLGFHGNHDLICTKILQINAFHVTCICILNAYQVLYFHGYLKNNICYRMGFDSASFDISRETL